MSEGEKETPLDVSWPKEWHKQITYVILFPIIILLWLTLPDVRRTVSYFTSHVSLVAFSLFINFAN